jgi:hypothetical protein
LPNGSKDLLYWKRLLVASILAAALGEKEFKRAGAS